MSQFQMMSQKEKLDHIWYYYKWHIIGGIFSLYVITQLAVLMFGPKPPKPLVEVAIVGEPVDQVQVEDIAKEATKSLQGSNDKDRKVQIIPISIDYKKINPLTAASQQKLSAMIAAQELDIIIMENERFQLLAQQGAFLSLDNMEGFEDFNKQYECLVKAKAADNNMEKVYGIRLQNSTRYKRSGIVEQKYTIGIVANTLEEHNAFRFLLWSFTK